MNRMFLVVAIVLTGLLSVKAQNKEGFTINGVLKNYSCEHVYIGWWFNGVLHRDSAKVENGNFNFKGTVAHPVRIGMSRNQDGDFLNFFLENSKIQIAGDMNSLNEVKITGSKSQDEFENFQAFTRKSRKAWIDILNKRKEFAKRKDTAGFFRFDEEVKVLENKSILNQSEFVKNHPKSYVNLWILPRLDQVGISYEDLNELYSGLDRELKEAPAGVSIAKRLAKEATTAKGQLAKPFTLKTIEGKEISLADFRGQYVLIDFWASWCAPCRKENPNVVKAYQKYKNKNFTVLGVSLDSEVSSWKAAIDNDNLTWTQVSDLKGWKGEVVNQYNIKAIPANFLIDPNGIIVASQLKGDKLEQKLAEILK